MSDHQGPFQRELQALLPEAEALRTRARRSLVLWIIRWAITTALYVYFWNHQWVRWTLLITAPLGLFSLYVIWKNAVLLPKRLTGLRAKAEEVDRMVIDDDDTHERIP